MDFSLTEEQQMFVEMFRDFAAKEVAKVAEHIDHAEEPPLALLKKAAAQGLLAPRLPEAYGGAALDWVSTTLLMEALGHECLSTALTIATHSALACGAILEVGTDAQKEAYLPRLAQGELGAFALTEPEAGSDTDAVTTRAQVVEGGYSLNGVKSWVTNAGLARVFIVFARDGASLRAFILERDTPGLSLSPREPTLGLRGLDIRTLYLEDVLVPEAQALSGGADLAQHALDRFRLCLAAAALGAAENALSLGIKFTAERKQFGTAIANKQAMQNYIAESGMEIEAARHLVQYAAWLADTAQPFTQAAHTAKYVAARAATTIANKMLQAHGGYGFSDEYAISRVYRDTRALRILGGTDESQRVVVARELYREAGVQISQQ